MPRPQENSRQTQERPVRRRIDPAKADIQDLTAYLATDTEAGLSPKESERRRLRRVHKSLFAAEKPKKSDCIVPILKEPVMWLMLAVAVVACIFDRADVGVPAILLMLLHGGVCTLMNLATKRLEKQMQAYDAPLSRVVRNRRVLRVPADQLVVGDVILLRRGDVIPADARLLSSLRLVVAEDTLDGDEARRETVILAKDARELPESIPARHSPVNMVYAGGLVKQGRGKAVVMATGERTHMGALLGKIPPSHENMPSQVLQKARKRLSVANLTLAVVAIPLTAIGILTLRDRYELLDFFATALALSVLTLTEHIFVFGGYLSTALRRTAADDPDPHLSCEIRNTETLEKLRCMDHLVLIGTSGLHDGKFMPESMLTCEQTYSCGQSAPDPAAASMADKLFLYAEGIKTAGYAWGDALSQAAEKVTAWAQPDTQSVRLRITSLAPYRDGVEVVMKRGVPTRLYLDEVRRNDPSFAQCAFVRCAVSEDGQEMRPMDDAVVEEWLSWISSAEKQGKRVLTLISEVDGETCAEGLIALEAEMCPKTKGCIDAMEAAGISVTVLMRDVSWENVYYLRQAGLLSGRETPHVLDRETPADMLTLAKGGVKAFAGCSARDMADYISALKAQGCTVGVLSVDGEDHPVLNVADIAMTCVPVSLKDAIVKGMPTPYENAESVDGYPDGDVATDLCRYTADVTVRRCSGNGGGVCGIRRALLTAEQMQKSGRLACQYIFLSQILRTVMVLLPLFMGLTVLSAPLILFSGFVMDLLAFMCFTRTDVPTELTSRRMEKAYPKREEKRPAWLSDLPIPMCAMIVTAASCVIPWTAALVAKLMNFSFGADLGYFGMLCLLGTQVALLVSEKLPRRRRVGFFVTVLAVCVYAGSLSIALAQQLSVLWCLLIPLAQPLCLYVALKVCQRIYARKNA